MKKIGQKIIILVGMVIGCIVTKTYAQNTPDINAIRDSISNPNSKLYYPTLFDRYRFSDTTLTLNDYHYLYYGYPEQPNYMPLLDNSARKDLENIMGNRTTPTAEDYNTAILLATSILEIEPFNMRDLNALAYLYAMTGQEARAQEIMKRVNMIATTIINSGMGVDKNSPWWVIYFNHAVDVMNMRGYDFSNPIALSREVEFYPVSNLPNKRNNGLYFNHSEVYRKDPSYLKGKEAPKRKMQFNNL